MDVYLLVAVLLDSAELRDACHQLVHRGIDGRIGSLSRAAARPDEVEDHTHTRQTTQRKRVDFKDKEPRCPTCVPRKVGEGFRGNMLYECHHCCFTLDLFQPHSPSPVSEYPAPNTRPSTRMAHTSRTCRSGKARACPPQSASAPLSGRPGCPYSADARRVSRASSGHAAAGLRGLRKRRAFSSKGLMRWAARRS